MSRSRHARSSIALGAVGVLVAGALAVLAVRDPGYPARAVGLSQSDVWVTNQQELLVGRINKQIDELDSAVRTNAPFDVLQDGRSVLVLDGSKHELRPLDEVSVTLGGRIPTPQSAAVAMGGGVLAVADEKTGAVWSGSPQELLSLDPASSTPTVKTRADVAITVAQDGSVFAAAPGSATLWTIRPADAPDATGADDGSLVAAVSAAASSAESAGSSVVRESLTGGPLSPTPSGAASPVSITAVGAVPVVLDRAAGRLRLPGRSVPIPDASTAILQQPGPESGSVLVATTAALLRVSLTDGAVSTLVTGRSGAPAAPVLLDGCVHAAWSSSPAEYAMACGDAPASTREVPGHTGSSRMVFRVNRHTIVLNDVTTGAIWTTDGDLTLINNWDEVQPLSETSTDAQDNSGTEGNAEQQTASHTNCAPGKVDPPAPQPDKFGVRAGRSTVLRVLDNDGASDCSLSVITGVDGWTGSSDATAAVVDGGRAVQVTVPDGASGELPELTYHVSDGRGHDAKAGVAVTVVPADQHDPPVKLHDSSVPVESLGTVSYNVLGNYLSPDGDDLFLASASIDNGDEVTFQPDGTITFTDTGVEGAVKTTVNFVVSDGSNQLPGKLIVDVRPQGTAEPLASPVYSKAVVGRLDTVDVLASVTEPSVEPTTLSTVTPVDKGDEAAAAMVGPIDPAAGTVRITGTKAGTYYFNYQVGSGSKTANGLLRVDVINPSSDPKPPVAMTDVVYLPTSGVATVDPTANDTDPMAAGLAVVDVDADPSLTVATENMQVVTVSAQSVLGPEGASIRYTVSNGYDTATGLIRVLPVPAQEAVPPIARDIDLTVRAGDAATVPIADHAVDPNGDIIKITGLGTDQLPADSGVLFHTDSAVRYLAPAAAPAKPLQFSYTVTNTASASATAAVTIQVDGSPRTSNQDPTQPAAVLARVFVGSTVAISVPLDGIDPDGDWVSLQDIARDPTLGRAAITGLSEIDYTAGDVPGYDNIQYTAADPYGGTVLGQIAVLVVATPTTLRAPTAPNLTTTARPGKTVAVNVVGQVAAANNGQQISLAKPGFESQNGWTVSEDHSGKSLLIKTPSTPTVGSIKYSVVNQAGLTASGVLTVKVSETDPLKPPTAKDVVVDPATIKSGQQTVTVPVPDDKLTNPSGTIADLVLTLDPQSAGAGTPSGHSVLVHLTSSRQVLAYRVTNEEKGTATAFIVVPGVNAPPQAAQTEPVQPTKTTAAPPEPLHVSTAGTPLKVKAGQSLTIDVAVSVKASDGAKLEIPNGSKPTVTNGGEIGRVDATHVRYTAPKNGNGVVYVSIPVSDGTRPATRVTVPVTVIPVVIPAPTVQQISLQVEAGTAKKQDVAKLVTAGNAEQQKKLGYRVSGGGNGITGSLDGTVLTVTAPLSAKGKTATFTLTATDGQGKSGSAPITVTATGSLAPRLKISDVSVTNGRPGVASVVQVLQSVTYNPFGAAPTLVSATKQSGQGTVSAKGGTVSITPTAVGTVVAAFTLRDATGDSDRDVSATITVTVQDKPTAPGTPTVVSMSSRTVQIKWTASKPNGSPITKYIASSGSFSQDCDASPCTLTKLTNGTEYEFSVVAVNAIGTSDPSKASAPITPDTAPNTPAAPAVTWLDGQQALQIDWKDPGSDGTPVSSYDLQISPADGAGTTQVTVEGATNYTWKKLSYGQQYTFKVRAHNASKTASGWSGASKAETPSTKPGAPTGVKVTFGPDNYNSGGNTLTVSWKAPQDDGGAPLKSYVVNYTSSAGSKSIPVPDPSTTSVPIQGVSDGVKYTVTVTAVNRSGPGDASAPSSATPYSPPGAVSGLTAAATGASGQVALSWQAAEAHGRAIDHYQVTVDGNPVSDQPTGTSYTAGGLSNGADHAFTVAACYSNDDASFNTCGASKSASGNPYAPVANPGSTDVVRGQTSVAFSWANPPDNGRGPMTSQWSIDKSNWTTGISHTIGQSCGGAKATLYVRGIDSAGHASGTVTLSGTTTSCPPPPRVVTVLKGSSTSACGTYCYYVDITLSGFPANASVNIYFNSDHGDFSTSTFDSNQRFTVNSSGNLPETQSYVFFGYPTGWVSATATDYGVAGKKDPWGK